jgi:glycosidase
MRGNVNARVHQLRDRFRRLYPEIGHHCIERAEMMVGRYGVGVNVEDEEQLWSEKSAYLITYGDMVHAHGEPPIKTLHDFVNAHLSEAFDTVHILPFFPYSSDDGFSVIDYRQVNPALGSWEDVEAFAKDYRIMSDLVLNHCSRQSRWFKDYTSGIMPALFYFIEENPDTDLSAVVRPRAHPLLTRTQTRDGERHVWTTFSDDQIDLNFANPDVLFEFIDILFGYIARGIRVIRLDAIAYLWKQVGTSCIHLPKTHEVVKLFRDVVDLVAPGTVIITETNVPHKENISYFGDGDEAHMVYQFTLPPLLLHALQSGTSQHLSAWAKSLPDLPPGQTFFNFTASHDGIGVRPLEGILPNDEILKLAEGVRERGGMVSTKANTDGSESPYELNVSYFDALADPAQAEDKLHVARFMCSQAVAMALRGVPAVYFNSLLGAPNNTDGVQKTGRARTINRQKWELHRLEENLVDKSSVASQVLKEYTRLLSVRGKHPAFHPDGRQDILDLGEKVFAVQRTSPDGGETIAAISNLTDKKITVKINDRIPCLGADCRLKDLLRKRNGGLEKRSLSLGPYRTAWLTASTDE